MTVGDPVCDCPHCSRARELDEAERWVSARDLEAWSKLPETLYLAKCIRVITFYNNDNQRPEFVRDHLVKLLRRMSDDPDDICSLIADLLDPASKTEWRLDLRRRRAGSPRKLCTGAVDSLCNRYKRRVDRLREAGRAAPVKTALGELAAEYEMTDNEMRAILERAQGKRRRPRR
jgi:hypothetical protein